MLYGLFRIILMITASHFIVMMWLSIPMQRCMGQILRARMINLHPLTTACEGLEQDGEQQDSGKKLTEHELESCSQVLKTVPLWQPTWRVSHIARCTAKPSINETSMQTFLPAICFLRFKALIYVSRLLNRSSSRSVENHPWSIMADEEKQLA